MELTQVFILISYLFSPPSPLLSRFSQNFIGGEVAVSKDGRFLYASNRGNNSIAISHLSFYLPPFPMSFFSPFIIQEYSKNDNI
jgi:hypothetical protein